jgi:hypothetical protein
MVDRPKEIRAEGQKLLPRIRAKAKKVAYWSEIWGMIHHCVSAA